MGLALVPELQVSQSCGHTEKNGGISEMRNHTSQDMGAGCEVCLQTDK